ncbi:MAG: SDR family oxidoreductase [Mariprofundales bacterium]
MKILILGGNGMLGHQFFNAWQTRHEVKVTLRGQSLGDATRVYTNANSYSGIDVRVVGALEGVLEQFMPDAVVNAVGITKQIVDTSNVMETVEINALFPHRLADVCANYEVKLVHLSTDCIFSGKAGGYDEAAISDAEDLYGRSKFLGEVDQAHVVTLRKSTIGLELSGAHGLVEWFLQRRGTIKGFRKAIYSGLISSELARVIETVLLDHRDLSGVWNVASAPIDKFDLLTQLSQRLGRRDVNIEPDDGFVCDRSLNGAAFCKKTGYIAPSWDSMLDELAMQIEDRNNDFTR